MNGKFMSEPAIDSETVKSELVKEYGSEMNFGLGITEVPGDSIARDLWVLTQYSSDDWTTESTILFSGYLDSEKLFNFFSMSVKLYKKKILSRSFIGGIFKSALDLALQQSPLIEDFDEFIRRFPKELWPFLLKIVFRHKNHPKINDLKNSFTVKILYKYYLHIRKKIFLNFFLPVQIKDKILTEALERRNPLLRALNRVVNRHA
ncbi:MAG TPA: hypothetical protein DC049_01440 [Spirochaetia bacterium]|nr:hypothetical protein [Spirochaetia bacterium]